MDLIGQGTRREGEGVGGSETVGGIERGGVAGKRTESDEDKGAGVRDRERGGVRAHYPGNSVALLFTLVRNLLLQLY